MKKIAASLAALLFLLLQVGWAFAQASDFEIIESFKKSHLSLLEAIKTVQDPGHCILLEEQIGRLEGESAPHSKLLAEGLYPSTFEAAIATLRDQLKKSTERVLLAEERKKDKVTIEEKTRDIEVKDKTIKVITAQNDEYRASLEKMSRELQDLSARIQQLSTENTGLLAKIKALQSESRKDKESIDKLKQLTDKLNANIRDRDDLIVKMMDSLFDEYSKTGLTDAPKKNLLAVAQESDYVSKIVTTVDGNIAFVETALLSPQDVKTIRDQQRRLTGKWEEIKPFVGKLYPNEQTRTRDISMVDGRLADLKRRTDEATWRSIHQVFAGNGIAVDPFRTAAEFTTNLMGYIDGQLKNPSRETFQVFKRKVWDSPVKDQWLPVIPTDELTEKQRSDIEARIALWEKKAAALLWRWVLIGLFGVVVLATAAVLILRKKKTAPAA